MIDNIQNTFIDMLEESSWMDKISRARAVEKVSKRNTLFQLFTDKNEIKYRPELSGRKLAIPTI